MILKSVLTKEIYDQLKQGSKIEFKWFGNSEYLYIGRVELSENGDKYFVNEHNYKDDKLKESCEGLRFYNSLESFTTYTHFKILSL